MLKKRSTAACKQAPMADYRSLPSPNGGYRNLTSSMFSSQKLFLGVSSFTESVPSPTSILDSKPFSPLSRNPFWSDPDSEKQNPRISGNKDNESGSKKVGLSIVDDLTSEKPDPRFSKPRNAKILFGSKLEIQIPSLLPSSVLSLAQSPGSPGDFGIKTRNPQSVLFSPSPERKSLFQCENSGVEKPDRPAEMELLEEYTCVISHGPNPKTTHIFDDCVVESCCGVNRSMSYPSESFLSFCSTCRKNLGPGKDIYMYRGEKGFCSSECRHQGMMLEDEERAEEEEGGNGV